MADDISAGWRFTCDYCQDDITKVTRIRCGDPECVNFDLCLQCFSAGVEVAQHKVDLIHPVSGTSCFPFQKHHAYQVIGHVTAPIFSTSWGAHEELLLLEVTHIK
jgi:transcriptional adapter 2-alpha